jgi:hypothetical protein
MDRQYQARPCAHSRLNMSTKSKAHVKSGHIKTACLTANTTWYIYNFRSRLITSLVQNGWRVVALSPRDAYVSRLEQLGVRHVHLELDNLGTNPAREIACITGMVRTLRAERPHLVLTYTPKVNIYASLAAGILRIPVIANVSGLGRAFSTAVWMRLLTKYLYRLALRHPQVVFFQNEEDRTDFVKGGLVSETKARRLPGSGVDVDRFRPHVGPRRTKNTVFLLSARMLREKAR